MLVTSAAAFLALIGLVGWVAVANAGPPVRHLPPVGPAPLAVVPQNRADVIGGPVLVAPTDGLPAKLVAVLHGGTPSSLSPSVAAANDLSEASALAADGIPVTALRAYRQAAARERLLNPACGLTWPLLAAIGRVESDHGRSGGAVLHADGLSTPPIIGIALNGHGTALIRDTDHGRLDGDTVYDHAVGPMQFIPSTWASWGVDADHDGVANPFDIFDATAAAADYLCAAGGNLTTYAGQVRAVRSYNDSDSYISLVLAMERLYAEGAGVVVPVAPGTGASGPSTKPTLPPVNPGPPRGIGNRHHHRPHRTGSPSPSASTSRSHSPSPSSSASSDPAPSSSTSSSPSDSPTPCPSSSSPTESPSSSASSASSAPTCPSSSGSHSAQSSPDSGSDSAAAGSSS